MTHNQSFSFSMSDDWDNSTFIWTNETTETDQLDLLLLELPLAILQLIFVALGMILKAMIIYFEHFGRDTQKRSLLNRVSRCIIYYL